MFCEMLAKKNKKIQKKILRKGSQGGTGVSYGGGAICIAAKRNFHDRNGRCGDDKRRTNSQTTKIVRITYFPSFVTIQKIVISKM